MTAKVIRRLRPGKGDFVYISTPGSNRAKAEEIASRYTTWLPLM